MKTRFDLLQIGYELSHKVSEEMQVSRFLYCIGPEAKTVFLQMAWTESDKKKYKPVVICISQYFAS